MNMFMSTALYRLYSYHELYLGYKFVVHKYGSPYRTISAYTTQVVSVELNKGGGSKLLKKSSWMRRLQN